MALTWSGEYATNEPMIDLQHKQLFESANEIENLVAVGKFDGPEVDRLIRFLGTYLTSHFSFEEVCMKKHQCPVLEKNKAAHAGFLKLFGDFADNYKKTGGSLGDLKKLHSTAEDWLVSHIMKIDTHLRECLNA